MAKVADAWPTAVPIGAPVEPMETPYVRVGASQFSDSLFSCFNDCKLFLVSLLCPYVLVGQLFQRVKRHRNAFIYIFAFGLVSAVAGIALRSGCPADECKEVHGVLSCAEKPPHCQYADIASLLSFLVLAYLFMQVRSHLRAQHGIPPTCCGGVRAALERYYLPYSPSAEESRDALTPRVPVCPLTICARSSTTAAARCAASP